MRKHMTILGISGKQRIKLDVFVNFLKKKPLFLHFKTTTFFFVSFYSFEGVQYFWVELWIVFSKLVSATNQQLFYVTEGDIGTSKPCSTTL